MLRWRGGPRIRTQSYNECACDRSARAILKQKLRTSSSSFILFYFSLSFWLLLFYSLECLSCLLFFGWLDQTLYFITLFYKHLLGECIDMFPHLDDGRLLAPDFSIFLFSMALIVHRWKSMAIQMSTISIRYCDPYESSIFHLRFGYRTNKFIFHFNFKMEKKMESICCCHLHFPT